MFDPPPTANFFLIDSVQITGVASKESGGFEPTQIPPWLRHWMAAWCFALCECFFLVGLSLLIVLPRSYFLFIIFFLLFVLPSGEIKVYY